MYILQDNISFVYSTRIYVCLKPFSFGTDGPIWKIIFLLVQYWSGEGFRQKKNVDFGSKGACKFGYLGGGGVQGRIFEDFIIMKKKFGLKPSPDQDWTNKKIIFQIGPSVPKEIGFKQTSIALFIKDISIMCSKSCMYVFWIL